MNGRFKICMVENHTLINVFYLILLLFLSHENSRHTQKYYYHDFFQLYVSMLIFIAFTQTSHREKFENNVMCYIFNQINALLFCLIVQSVTPVLEKLWKTHLHNIINFFISTLCVSIAITQTGHREKLKNNFFTLC